MMHIKDEAKKGLFKKFHDASVDSKGSYNISDNHSFDERFLELPQPSLSEVENHQDL